MMKCLMTMVAAALALAVAAQDSAEVKAVRPRGGQTVQNAKADPILNAALNPKVAEKLGVSEEQTAKLKALTADKEELKGLQEKVRAGLERQAQLLSAEKIDEAAVLQAFDEVWEARKEIARRQTKRLIAVRSILTSEQVAQAQKVLKEIRSARKAKAKTKAAPRGVK